LSGFLGLGEGKGDDTSNVPTIQMKPSISQTNDSRSPLIPRKESLVSKSVLSLLDQSIVSGTSFLTTIIIGRFCGADELGKYALAMTIVVLASNLQTAVFTSPYTIYSTRLTDCERREYAWAVLVHCIGHMFIWSSLLLVFGIVSIWLPENFRSIPVVGVLVVGMPFFLLREALRRFAFAHLQVMSVLVLDFVISVAQLSGMIALMSYKRLSAANVLLLIGFVCMMTGCLMLASFRINFAVNFRNVVPELIRSWRLGRWLAAVRLTAMLQTYSVQWLLVFIVSTSASGVFSASTIVVLLANPFVIGISNLLETRASHAFSTGGIRELDSVLWQSTKLLGTCMTLFCLFATLFGGMIVETTFQGIEYAHQGTTVTVLAIAAMINAWETGAIFGLRILERPDLSFRASILSLCSTVAIGFALIPCLGTVGGALAILTGDSAAASMRWYCYTTLKRVA
jgi:O-antigen/teichoic acid export membrane protein